MRTWPLAWLALRAITLYQRYLSPRKGYRCALHAAGRGRSCSAYGYRAMTRAGMIDGWVLLQRRLAACGRVHASRTRPAHVRGMAYQQGFCDLDCDVCDLVDAVDCCDCDWRRKRKRDDER